VSSTGGVLTLNGPATGTWIFKVGTLGTGALSGTSFTVTTAAGTPPPCNSVYWWTADAASLTDSAFVGTILAGAAATVTRGTFSGNVYAKAAVTLTGPVAITGCGPGAGTGGGGTDGGTGSGTDGGTCKGEDGEDEECACQESDGEDGHGSKSSKSSTSSKDSEHANKCGERKHPHDRGHGDGHDSR
jgi:hypothetical protein